MPGQLLAPLRRQGHEPRVTDQIHQPHHACRTAAVPGEKTGAGGGRRHRRVDRLRSYSAVEIDRHARRLVGAQGGGGADVDGLGQIAVVAMHDPSARLHGGLHKQPVQGDQRRGHQKCSPCAAGAAPVRQKEHDPHYQWHRQIGP